jgi:DNA-binding NarL/FixJ family response regulator
MPISLVLADDHPFLLTGLQNFISTEPDFTILATCSNGEETLQAIQQYQPDILILDIRMPGMNGLAVLNELKKAKHPVKVVILTAELGQYELLKAIQLGVRGVLLKEMAPHFLIQCLRKVYEGGTWLENRSIAKSLEKILHYHTEQEQIGKLLTAREIDLVRLVAGGLDNSQIADKLNISENTVKVHFTVSIKSFR